MNQHTHTIHTPPVVIIAGIVILSLSFFLSHCLSLIWSVRVADQHALLFLLVPHLSRSLSLSLPLSRLSSTELSLEDWEEEGGRRRRRWCRECEREEGGTWQWGDAEREISLSPSLLRGRHWAPETGACGSFTGSGCFLIHWLAMDVRRGQWREGRGRWCYWEAVPFQRQTNKLCILCVSLSVRAWVLNLIIFFCACGSVGCSYWMETLQHVYFCVFLPCLWTLCACVSAWKGAHIDAFQSDSVGVFHSLWVMISLSRYFSFTRTSRLSLFL